MNLSTNWKGILVLTYGEKKRVQKRRRGSGIWAGGEGGIKSISETRKKLNRGNWGEASKEGQIDALK